MNIYACGFKDNYAYYVIDNKYNVLERNIGCKPDIENSDDAEMYAIMLSILRNFDKCKYMRIIHRGNRIKKLVKGKVIPRTVFEYTFVSFVKSYRDDVCFNFSIIYDFTDREEYVKVKNKIEEDVMNYVPVSRGDISQYEI